MAKALERDTIENEAIEFLGQIDNPLKLEQTERQNER